MPPYLSTAVDVGGLAHHVVLGGPDGGRGPLSVAREGSYGLTGGTQRDVLPRANGVGPCRPATQLAHQVVGGIGRAGVVPQERRAYDVADLVERHHPVLLSSHPGVALSERSSGRVGVVS